MADTQATETPAREQGPTWGKADDFVISAFMPMLTLLEVAYHASESAIKPGPEFGPSFFELLEETLGRCMVRVSETSAGCISLQGWPPVGWPWSLDSILKNGNIYAVGCDSFPCSAEGLECFAAR